MNVDYSPTTRAALKWLKLERLRATVAHAYRTRPTTPAP